MSPSRVVAPRIVSIWPWSTTTRPAFTLADRFITNCCHPATNPALNAVNRYRIAAARYWLTASAESAAPIGDPRSNLFRVSACAYSTGSPFCTTYGGTWLAHDTRLFQASVACACSVAPSIPRSSWAFTISDQVCGNAAGVTTSDQLANGPSLRSTVASLAESIRHIAMNSSTPSVELKSSCCVYFASRNSRSNRAPSSGSLAARASFILPWMRLMASARAPFGSAGKSSASSSGSLAAGLAVSSSPPKPPSSSEPSSSSSGAPPRRARAARPRARSRARAAWNPRRSTAGTGPRGRTRPRPR